jgi:hypothetical protein
MRAFDVTSQQKGDNPCTHGNGLCRSLCTLRPNSADLASSGLNRTCLCSDMYVTKTLKPNSADETCECLPGETFDNNSMCVAHNGTKCGVGQFTCKSLRCIPATWRCDRDNDCGDMSDEMDCSKLTRLHFIHFILFR